MDELHQESFTGLIVRPPGPNDYILGGENNRLGNLGLIAINPTGDWRDFLPFPQVQSRPGVFDTSDCTGFGYCRRLSTRLNGMRHFGLLSNRFIEWAKAKNYIQVQDGKESFMFDPRVLGIMAGTTANGNYLQKVTDTARKMGLAPAGTLLGPEFCNSTDEYYNPALVTDEIKRQCLELLQYLDLPYNWISNDPATAAAALKADPLYVALCTCGGWNKPPVDWCNAGDASNHCVAEVYDQYILDSYPPFLKQLSGDYAIPYKMQVLAVERLGVKKMIGYQLAGNPTVYVEMGGKLIPISDWQAFLNMGGSSNTVVTLNDEQFAKFERISGVFFKAQ